MNVYVDAFLELASDPAKIRQLRLQGQLGFPILPKLKWLKETLFSTNYILSVTQSVF